MESSQASGRVVMIDGWRRLVCAGFLLSVVVDTLTGMIDGPPLSLAYKAALCVAAVATLNSASLRILTVVASAFMVALLHTATMHSLIWLDVVWAMRNIMLLIATLFFIELLSGPQRVLWQRRTLWWCGFAGVIFTANVLAGLMGAGLSQYSAATGYTAGGKGFIHAGNEMVTAMLAINAILILACARMRVAVRAGLYLLMTMVLVMSGTKSGILGLFVLIALREGMGVNITAAQRLLMLGMLTFALWFGYDTLLNSFAGRRFTWFWETQGLTRALLSNRDYWASLALESYLSGTRHVADLFLGAGAALIERATNGKSIIEMDPVDFFVSYGVVGLAASHAVFALVLHRVWLRRRDRFLPLAFVGLFVMLSMLTGHVLNGGTSAPYLAVMLAVLATGRLEVFAGDLVPKPLAQDGDRTRLRRRAAHDRPHPAGMSRRSSTIIESP